MAEYNFLVLPFRKLRFAEKYGYTVRDLMMLRALLHSSQVRCVRWLERPDTIPEYIRNSINPIKLHGLDEFSHPSAIDFNIFGAIRYRRAWSKWSLSLHEKDMKNWSLGKSRGQKIILDFHPFYIPPVELIKKGFYWYDVIDNFAKHNRFTLEERKIVEEKYRFVREHADIVTGVTQKAVEQFDRSFVMPNRLLKEDWNQLETEGEPKYDFGFLGFITDKIDIELIAGLAAVGHSIFLCGHCYQKEIERKLRNIPNVTMYGGFSSADVPNLLNQFRVGLIPYKVEKLHDESPIKFFQYVSGGKPVVTSTQFNDVEKLFVGFVHYYKTNEIGAVTAFMKETADREADIRKIAHSLPQFFWEDSFIEEMKPFLPR